VGGGGACRVFAVGAVGQPRPLRGVPEVARRGHVGERAVLRLAVAAIVGGPGLLVLVGGVGGVGPRMAVLAHVAVGVAVVERGELLGHGMLVGRDLAAEDGEVRPAVGVGQVAE